MRSKRVVTVLASLFLLGSGCSTVPVSSLTPEQATESLVFRMGHEIVVRPTVLGIGGTVAGWFGADEEERAITITQWVPGQTVGLDWSITTQVESAESLAARTAHQQTYASSAVGVEIPSEPEPVYEEQVVSGSISSDSLAFSDTLSLPELWQEGDGGFSTSSLIWLSRTHYDELVNTRATVVSLGLFDESLLRVENTASQITSVVDILSGLLDPIFGTKEESTQETEVQTQSLLTLEADSQWGEYTLLIDGVKTTVQVVVAKNAFASYKILANADNPLILEIQLTPLARGNLEVLHLDGIAQGFGGYEITRIASSSEDPPQP